MYLHFTKKDRTMTIFFYKNVSLAGGYLYGIEQNYLDTCDFLSCGKAEVLTKRIIKNREKWHS